MPDRPTLALTPDGRWTASIQEVIAATAGAGFKALGIRLDQASVEAAQRFAEAGLYCHELLALLVTDDEDQVLAAAQVAAEAAATMGAPFVLTVFGAPLTDQTAAIIARAAAVMDESGVKMAVEFSPLGPISTLGAALEVVEAAGLSRAGVMIDSWHFCNGESSWADLEAVPLERIAYVQFADALAPISERRGSETMNRRALPGEGVLELDRFVEILARRGFTGTVSIEVLSEELRTIPIAEFAKRAHRSAAHYWG
jgi:sugar phosphate isomerase/epimerase